MAVWDVREHKAGSLALIQYDWVNYPVWGFAPRIPPGLSNAHVIA